MITNGSRETTVAEIIAIEGADEWTKRNAGLNLMAGTTNAVEICVTVMKAKTFQQCLKAFNEDHQDAA